MSRAERTAETVIKELIEKASIDRYFFMEGRSAHWSISPSNVEKFNNQCAEEVGQYVLNLPEDDRNLLANMSSDELERFGWIVHGYYRPRPEKPVTRRRGAAISFSK